MTKHYIKIPDDHFLVGGVAVVQLIGPDGENILQVLPLGKSPLWSQIGWLQGSLDKQRELLKKQWLPPS